MKKIFFLTSILMGVGSFAFADDYDLRYSRVVVPHTTTTMLASGAPNGVTIKNGWTTTYIASVANVFPTTTVIQDSVSAPWLIGGSWNGTRIGSPVTWTFTVTAEAVESAIVGKAGMVRVGNTVYTQSTIIHTVTVYLESVANVLPGVTVYQGSNPWVITSSDGWTTVYVANIGLTASVMITSSTMLPVTVAGGVTVLQGSSPWVTATTIANGWTTVFVASLNNSLPSATIVAMPNVTLNNTVPAVTVYITAAQPSLDGNQMVTATNFFSSGNQSAYPQDARQSGYVLRTRGLGTYRGGHPVSATGTDYVNSVGTYRTRFDGTASTLGVGWFYGADISSFPNANGSRWGGSSSDFGVVQVTAGIPTVLMNNQNGGNAVFRAMTATPIQSSGLIAVGSLMAGDITGDGYRAAVLSVTNTGRGNSLLVSVEYNGVPINQADGNGASLAMNMSVTTTGAALMGNALVTSNVIVSASVYMVSFLVTADYGATLTLASGTTAVYLRRSLDNSSTGVVHCSDKDMLDAYNDGGYSFGVYVFGAGVSTWANVANDMPPLPVNPRTGVVLYFNTPAGTMNQRVHAIVHRQ